jgi:hypothetical protein
VPTTKNLLDLTVGHATRYLETVDTRPIATTSTIDALRERLGRPLPEAPMASDRVINELVRDTAGGILGSTNPRFFGWEAARFPWLWPPTGSPQLEIRTQLRI